MFPTLTQPCLLGADACVGVAQHYVAQSQERRQNNRGHDASQSDITFERCPQVRGVAHDQDISYLFAGGVVKR